MGRRCGRRGVRRPRRHLRNLGQVSDIGHELPDLMVRQVPGGHAGVTDTVADVVKKLTVRRCRDGGRAKRGRTRVFAGTGGGFSAAVIGVANFAFFPVELSPRRDVGGIRPLRIDAPLCGVWNRLVQQPGRNDGLGRRWLAAGARQAWNEHRVETAKNDGDCYDNADAPDEDFSRGDLFDRWHIASLVITGRDSSACRLMGRSRSPRSIKLAG